MDKSRRGQRSREGQMGGGQRGMTGSVGAGACACTMYDAAGRVLGRDQNQALRGVLCSHGPRRLGAGELEPGGGTCQAVKSRR